MVTFENILKTGRVKIEIKGFISSKDTFLLLLETQRPI